MGNPGTPSSRGDHQCSGWELCCPPWAACGWSSNAFRSNGVLWGLGSLLVPFVAQIYGVLNFAENKIPLLLSVVGIAMFFMGYGSYVEQMQAMQAAAEAMPQ